MKSISQQRNICEGYIFFNYLHIFCISSTLSRDHSGFGLSQWKTKLHCNAITHWLSPYLDRFLLRPPIMPACLTRWGRVTHICINKLTNIGSDNGLSPGQRQAIIWTNAGILLIGPLGTNFSEILIKIYTFSFKKMHLKMSSGKCRPSCLSLDVLTLENMLSCIKYVHNPIH